MPRKNKPAPISRHDRLAYLLGAYGDDTMSATEFWRHMGESGFDQSDIDAWCAEFHGSVSNEARGPQDAVGRAEPDH